MYRNDTAGRFYVDRSVDAALRGRPGKSGTHIGVPLQNFRMDFESQWAEKQNNNGEPIGRT